MVGGAAAGNKIKSQKQIGIIITDVYVTLVMELITQHGPVLHCTPTSVIASQIS